MRIKNQTAGTIQIADLPGAQRGQSLVIGPGAELLVFNEDAERSSELGSLLASGHVLNLGPEEPGGLQGATQAALVGGAPVTVTNAPVAGRVLIASSATAASWQPPAEGGLQSVSNVLASPASTLAITGLDLDSALYLDAMLLTTVTAAGSLSIFLQPNGDSTPANFSPASAVPGLGFEAAGVSSGDPAILSVMVVKHLGGKVMFVVSAATINGGVSPSTFIWNNPLGQNLASLTFVSAANGMTPVNMPAGSRLTVEVHA